MLGIGKSYSMVLKVPKILGAGYTNMKCVSICTLEEAINTKDVMTVHKSLSAVSSDELLKKPATACTWYKFIDQANGSKQVIAGEWMESYDELVVETGVNITVASTNVSPEVILAALKAVGVTNVSVTNINS
jgi:hypothetical protein